jgi:Leucine-rich repeat (LRR) protein
MRAHVGGLALLLVLSLTLSEASGSPECETQLLQLSAIYGKLNGDLWTNQKNWLQTTAECGCDWWGVYCQGAGQNITNLQLSDNDCSGFLPDMELIRLPYLTRVALNGNQIGGAIPDEMGQLWNLQTLDLSWNRLTGSIPPKLGQLVLMNRLLLYHNLLTGTLPDSLGNLVQLEHFFADRNQLSGAIPGTFGGMHALMELSLFENKLTSVPGTLSQSKNLTTLALQQNNITGPLDPRLEALARQVDSYKPATEGCMLAGNPLQCPVPVWASELCHAKCVHVAPPELENLEGLASPKS